jgi:DNA-nicking Smr family endonuclease
MARRRTLRPEEEDLWHSVARTANPLHAPHFLRKPILEPTPAPLLPVAKPRLNGFRLGETAQVPRTASVKLPSLAMDAKAFGKLTRGKLQPEARIDLHGLTLAEAHPELIRFILNAHTVGLRLVLVITGKGKPGTDTGPMPQRTGILRHQAPHWLRQPPLGQVILQVTESHLRHGGAGALYVYLRRAR